MLLQLPGFEQIPVIALGIARAGSHYLAIANAMFNATGVRVRELPIRHEALLAGRASSAPCA